MSAEPNKPRLMRHSSGAAQSGLEPIVFEYRSGKNKKKKKAQAEDNGKVRYTRNLKDVQEAEGDLVRAARRATKAIAVGVDTYDRERRRSAAAKKDGAIKDFPHNSATALSDSLKEASDIPVDLVDAVTAKNYRKRMRRELKRVSRALRLFRL